MSKLWKCISKKYILKVYTKNKEPMSESEDISQEMFEVHEVGFAMSLRIANV